MAKEQIHTGILASRDVGVEGGNRADRRLVGDARHHKELATLTDSLPGRMAEEQRVVVETNNFLRQSAAQIASAIPGKPLRKKEGLIPQQQKPLGKEGLPV